MIGPLENGASKLVNLGKSRLIRLHGQVLIGQYYDKRIIEFNRTTGQIVIRLYEDFSNSQYRASIRVFLSAFGVIGSASFAGEEPELIINGRRFRGGQEIIGHL